MKKSTKKTLGAILFLLILIGGFLVLGSKMGAGNMLKTIMNTAHDLLLNTVFYLMGITVLTGALSKLFSEFGVVGLLEKLLKPLMKPLFRLPGVGALGAVMTFLSDNPAIISLAKDKNFSKFFKKYQLVSLNNFGTAFGMGFVVIITMVGYGHISGALVGLFGAFVGSIISTRLMQKFTLKAYPEMDSPVEFEETATAETEEVEEKKESLFIRIMNAILDGGKNGVDLGLQIIPGVLIISTLVMMITFGPKDAAVGYAGVAYEGVPILPWLAEKIDFVFKWLFGFESMELIAFPMTALGAVGAALGLLPTFAANGILDANAIAVFTAMGMCWSGYLSTHTAMMDSLGYRKLISKALLAHTIAGLCAGIVAHWTFVLVSLIM